jgi:tetratricopeptide (TPR) repeat protein
MACWRNCLTPVVAGHRGTIVKSTGDGALLRFPTAGAALKAMIDFQISVARSESRFPRSRQLVFRIGIHLAPMIEEHGDIYGHGVNLAVRLQEAAEPGSILLSDAARRQLSVVAKESLTTLGRKRLKNIRELVPVHIWQDGVVLQVADRRLSDVIKTAILLIGLTMPTATMDDVVVAKHNVSADARHSTSNEEVLIFEAGSHSKGSSSDEPFRYEHIVGLKMRTPDVIIPTAMTPAQQSMRSRLEITEDAYLQALALYGRHTPADLIEAIRELNYGLRFQPDDSATHALLAVVYWTAQQNRWQLGQGLTRSEKLNRAKTHLARVRGSDPFAHMLISEMLTASGLHDQAIGEARKAIALKPDLGVGHHALGRALLFAGHAGEAEAPIRTAIRLDPHKPRYLFSLGFALFNTGRFDGAKRILARSNALNDENDWPHLLLAATSGFLGMKVEASRALGRFDRLSVPRRGWFASQIPYVHNWPFRDQRDRDRFHLGMVLAGAPDRTWLAAR